MTIEQLAYLGVNSRLLGMAVDYSRKLDHITVTDANWRRHFCHL